MRRCLVYFALLLPGFTHAARAGTITAGSYTLQNASVAGYSITGTVSVDGAGNVTGANLTFNDPDVANPSSPVFNVISSTGAYNGLSQSYLSTASNGGQISFFLNTTSDANGRFNLCLANVQCGTASGTVDPSGIQVYGFYNGSTNTSNSGLAFTNFTSGYLVSASSTPAVAFTPEPASIVMLGTGLFGLVGAVRSRSLRSWLGAAPGPSEVA